jgi:hypothetical protein
MEILMPRCCDNDVRWSHGQPFTFILDLTDNLYQVEQFLDADLTYIVDGGDGTTKNIAVWRLIKAIRHSPKQGQITVILQAADPGLSASGHGVSHKAPARVASPSPPDTVSGPVATFESSSSSSSGSSSANRSTKTHVAAQSGSSSSGSSSSSSSNANGYTPMSTVRVRFSLPNGVPAKV